MKEITMQTISEYISERDLYEQKWNGTSSDWCALSPEQKEITADSVLRIHNTWMKELAPYLTNNYDDSAYGEVAYFENAPYEIFKHFIGLDCAELIDFQCSTFNITQIIDFAKSATACTFDGYIVHPIRRDFRLTIHSVITRDTDSRAFENMFVGADELILKRGFQSCWYD